jgi:hypothetical protein
VAVNSGPPSDATSLGIPKVTNVRRRQVMSPAAAFDNLLLARYYSCYHSIKSRMQLL